jgi:hypothetical protein
MPSSVIDNRRGFFFYVSVLVFLSVCQLILLTLILRRLGGIDWGIWQLWLKARHDRDTH